jgi:hypothetical protein
MGEFWEEVEALAAALIEKGTLTEGEILKAIAVEPRALHLPPPSSCFKAATAASGWPGIKPG